MNNGKTSYWNLLQEFITFKRIRKSNWSFNRKCMMIGQLGYMLFTFSYETVTGARGAVQNIPSLLGFAYVWHFIQAVTGIYSIGFLVQNSVLNEQKIGDIKRQTDQKERKNSPYIYGLVVLWSSSYPVLYSA